MAPCHNGAASPPEASVLPQPPVEHPPRLMASSSSKTPRPALPDTTAVVFTAPTHSMAIPPKLQQSYSTSDIPTMKTGNVNLDANNHALVALADDRERHPGRRRLGLERRRGREQGGGSPGDATLKRQSILDDVVEDEPWKTVCRRHTWRGDGPGTVEGPSCPARGEETESCQAFTGPRKATGTATWPSFVVAIAAESRIQNTQSLPWAPFGERSLRGGRNVISFNRAVSNSPAQPSPRLHLPNEAGIQSTPLGLICFPRHHIHHVPASHQIQGRQKTHPGSTGPGLLGIS